MLEIVGLHVDHAPRGVVASVVDGELQLITGRIEEVHDLGLVGGVGNHSARASASRLDALYDSLELLEAPARHEDMQTLTREAAAQLRAQPPVGPHTNDDRLLHPLLQRCTHHRPSLVRRILVPSVQGPRVTSLLTKLWQARGRRRDRYRALARVTEVHLDLRMPLHETPPLNKAPAVPSRAAGDVFSASGR